MSKENKKTRTFATTDKIWEKAKKKALREGTTVSEKINSFLSEYVKPKKSAYSLTEQN
jgi:hypothetical protein